MARNDALKIIEDHKLIEDGYLTGGSDKQFVAKEIAQLIDTKKKKAIDEYIAEFKLKRSPKAKQQADPDLIVSLKKIIEEQKTEITKLNNIIAELEKKGDAAKNGGK